MALRRKITMNRLRNYGFRKNNYMPHNPDLIKEIGKCPSKFIGYIAFHNSFSYAILHDNKLEGFNLFAGFEYMDEIKSLCNLLSEE